MSPQDERIAARLAVWLAMFAGAALHVLLGGDWFAAAIFAAVFSWLADPGE